MYVCFLCFLKFSYLSHSCVSLLFCIVCISLSGLLCALCVCFMLCLRLLCVCFLHYVQRHICTTAWQCRLSLSSFCFCMCCMFIFSVITLEIARCFLLISSVSHYGSAVFRIVCVCVFLYMSSGLTFPHLVIVLCNTSFSFWIAFVRLSRVRVFVQNSLHLSHACVDFCSHCVLCPAFPHPLCTFHSHIRHPIET